MNHSRYSNPKNWGPRKPQRPVGRILFFMLLACLLGSWLGRR
ncbi:hypothetical protein MicB006_6037 [Micromonospora sp. B006]|nr:hypothetical protein MicB006_6037 [Micromonospora sp. B006]